MMSVALPKRVLEKIRQDISVIRFSPLDIRIIVRILVLVLVWKFLSTDYSAFPELLGGPEFFPLPSWLTPLIHGLQHVLFERVWKIQGVQLLGALLLIFSAWRMNRWVLLLGLLPVMLIESNAMLYRSQMYDLDIPAALLILLMLGPWKQMLTGDEKVTAAATWAGLTLTAYMGGAYFLTGLSKLAFDPVWWQHVRLDLLYPTMEVWHGYTFPDWLQPIAYQIHQILLKFPKLSEGLAFLTLLFELGWWTALFSRTTRFYFPLAMFVSHLFIFLSSGILFLSMALVAVSLVIPWRYLFSRMTLQYKESNPKCRQLIELLHRLDWCKRLEINSLPELTGLETLSAQDEQGSYVGIEAVLQAARHCPLLAAPVSMAFAPGFGGLIRGKLSSSYGLENMLCQTEEPVHIPLLSSSLVASLLLVLFLLWYPTRFLGFFPFSNYNQFGWTYAKTAQPAIVYRLAYYNPVLGQVKPIPNNYGGFFDYRLVQLSGQYIGLLSSQHVNPAAFQAVIGQFVHAIRPNNSDRWLLGPLAFPDHFVAKSEEIPADWLHDIYLLQGEYSFDGQALHSNWTILGKLHRD